MSSKTEDIVIRLKGNEYHLGMRRLLFHVLYENRPVNDLRLGIVLPEESFGFSIEDRFLEMDLFIDTLSNWVLPVRNFLVI